MITAALLATTVFYFVVASAASFIGIIASLMQDEHVTDGTWNFCKIVMSVGLYVVVKYLYSQRANGMWSNPWRHQSHMYRFNPVTNEYNVYKGYNNKWELVSQVSGDPMQVTFYDFAGTARHANPYDLFQNPLKPTKAEITLFEVEEGMDFSRLKKGMIKIVEGAG